MKQQTLAEGTFEPYRKKTRREEFLEQMEQVVPWRELCAVIEPHYPKCDGAGRPAKGLERMLRIYFLQQWFNLSDPGVEEALYDSRALRRFAGFDLGQEAIPDESTVLQFRHLLERHALGQVLFERVNAYLHQQGMKINRGTIVDATIINAPSSTKNQKKERDPDMRQTKKGNQWYFGMKGHIGVDSQNKLIHSAAVTGANVHDSQVLPELLHGNETRVWGDAAYTGQQDIIRTCAPAARDYTQKKAHRRCSLSKQQRRANRTKSKVRAKVEHAFHVIKRIFDFTKVRYRGLAKNAHRFIVTCALANLYIVRRRLLRPA